jgi:hypothetical protein
MWRHEAERFVALFFFVPLACAARGPACHQRAEKAVPMDRAPPSLETRLFPRSGVYAGWIGNLCGDRTMTTCKTFDCSFVSPYRRVRHSPDVVRNGVPGSKIQHFYRKYHVMKAAFYSQNGNDTKT